MSRFSRCWMLAFVLAVALLAPPATAGAAIEPPWCGTPMTDAAENLPDGTDPTDPVGSFPHIPYYAIGCTLEDIAARSDGRMQVEVAGRSALGRDMYKVTINPLDTVARRRDFQAWQEVRRVALDDPARGQALVRARAARSRSRSTSRAASTATSTRASTRTCS